MRHVPHQPFGGRRALPHDIEPACEQARVGRDDPELDVIGPNQERVQVKSLRYTDPGRNSVAESPLGEKGFDRLVIVCFEYDMTVREGWSIAGDELDPLLTRGSRPGRGRLTLGPRAMAAMERIAADVLLHRE